jgi:hypothetical protein
MKEMIMIERTKLPQRFRTKEEWDQEGDKNETQV